MFGTDLVVDLESDPVALISAVVDDDGEPVASRVWGIREISAAPPLVRVVVPAGEIDPGSVGRGFAVTGGDILTLVTIQMKGELVAIEPFTDDDQRVCDRYCDGYFGAVEQVDKIPRELMERTRPSSFQVAIVAVGEIYDQTPGPDAGRSIWAVGP